MYNKIVLQVARLGLNGTHWQPHTRPHGVVFCAICLAPVNASGLLRVGRQPRPAKSGSSFKLSQRSQGGSTPAELPGLKASFLAFSGVLVADSEGAIATSSRGDRKLEGGCVGTELTSSASYLRVMGPNLGKPLYPLGVLWHWHYSLVPDFSKSGTGTGERQSGTGTGERPRFRTNRGRGRGTVPAPGQIGDGRPVPVPGQLEIGDGDGDGDRGVRALPGTGPQNGDSTEHAEKSGRGAGAPAWPESWAAAPLPRWRCEGADARDVERAARKNHMRIRIIRCAAGAAGARRA
jgi:hypothetical protein